MAAGEVDLRVVGALDGDAGNSLGRERVVRTAIAAIERSRTAYGVRDIALGAIGLDGSGGIGKRTVCCITSGDLYRPSLCERERGEDKRRCADN
ncbi:hypothetical protein [Tractidigestivibacter montrealensis]|uniref:Uncharacterized protein n=1 Tax=Tractidigestivibacter montrealensis TaxID=2972466 RepID=A0ABT1ZAA9_9ACTN|nr:hypothetical protein [Tractidigestivibacter montrealensis]MCR9037137.1 hypothetical protein [Tractidigestivibacter montrealensis]